MLASLPSSRWNETTAAHLLSRAGFGGSPQEIADLTKMGMDQAVSYLVDYERIPDSSPRPDWAYVDPDLRAREEGLNAALKDADEETKRKLREMRGSERSGQLIELRYWWLRRMALGPRPFQEKMTLFWHGHFATGYDKVYNPYFLWLQNETLRQHALAPFDQLLTAVARDPAMLIYLDGASSHKDHPNENFAREVMELFALGENHYTEQDIQQAAKAYTGWGLCQNPQSPDFRQAYEYHPRDHDDGPKTVFGQTGNFTGEQVLGMIAAKPECARFIAAKIWRFFVQDEPPAPIVEALAAEFRGHGLELKHLMNVVFRSAEFYAPAVIRAQIKSPVQWLVQACHQLEGPLPTEAMALPMLASLGQELFQPPNVKGWPGGITWITTNSLFDRYNFAAALVEGQRVHLQGLEGRMHGVLNALQQPDGPLEIEPAHVGALFTQVELSTGAQFLDALQARFLNGKLVPQRLAPLQAFLKDRLPIAEEDIRKCVRLVMSTPEYQLT
jgi:uncharacterized protein (DUF1800 family)